MRPVRSTPAHQTDRLAELVCTNSFKSEDPTAAHGLLKRDMNALGSILLQAAQEARVPAGAALAVDREVFAARMTELVSAHPRISIDRGEVETVPESNAVIATGPLTSDALTRDLAVLLGERGLAFYDAIAPIVAHESIDHDVVFAQSRWGRGEGDDYLNCPMDRGQYEAFLHALREADVYPGHDWEALPHTRADAEDIPYFEGCLPIEVMAGRGDDTLRFGPMKPIGLRDPRTGQRPYAVVQLRREDRQGQMWNMVGFQTRLRTGAQRRVFRMIPGLENAEFLRTGSIHRNTYLNFPACLTAWGAPHTRPGVIIAGQLTGVEGYTESAASGILAGVNLDRIARGLEPVVPPPTTMLGALFHYLRSAAPAAFQPMNSNFGLLAPLDAHVRDKQRRREALAERAQSAMRAWMREHDISAAGVPQPAASTV
jgi:methylenetetrahydrofolate--tRNA-(uracil-5-)-methyltransferase